MEKRKLEHEAVMMEQREKIQSGHKKDKRSEGGGGAGVLRQQKGKDGPD